MTKLFKLRQEYSLKTLEEIDLSDNPQQLFEQWLQEAIDVEALEPNAMCLSTADSNGRPSSRFVLLKQIDEEGMVFFSNYHSKKGVQLKQNNYCAASFIWLELQRQVIVEGVVEKLPEAKSDIYFDFRPEGGQLGAWASPQSQSIPNREYLDELIKKYKKEFADKKINRPPHWGGYVIKPHMIEFWQGRENRMHDRIRYSLASNGHWEINRIAP